MRRFKFRVREGHQIHGFGDHATTHGPGYEFELSETDAANLMRDSHARRSFDLVEIVEDDEATSASVSRPSRRTA
jgi:hypothetical protein